MIYFFRTRGAPLKHTADTRTVFSHFQGREILNWSLTCKEATMLGYYGNRKYVGDSVQVYWNKGHVAYTLFSSLDCVGLSLYMEKPLGKNLTVVTPELAAVGKNLHALGCGERRRGRGCSWSSCQKNFCLQIGLLQQPFPDLYLRWTSLHSLK